MVIFSERFFFRRRHYDNNNNKNKCRKYCNKILIRYWHILVLTSIFKLEESKFMLRHSCQESTHLLKISSIIFFLFLKSKLKYHLLASLVNSQYCVKVLLIIVDPFLQEGSPQTVIGGPGFSSMQRKTASIGTIVYSHSQLAQHYLDSQHQTVIHWQEPVKIIRNCFTYNSSCLIIRCRNRH